MADKNLQDVPIGPINESQVAGFMATNKGEVGRLWIEEDVVHFEGNISECTAIFVEHIFALLKPKIDSYVEQVLETHEKNGSA